MEITSHFEPLDFGATVRARHHGTESYSIMALARPEFVWPTHPPMVFYQQIFLDRRRRHVVQSVIMCEVVSEVGGRLCWQAQVVLPWHLCWGVLQCMPPQPISP